VKPASTQSNRLQDNIELLRKELELQPNESFPEEYRACFNDLWDDDALQSAILRGNESALHDNLD
jgi:hypothetical protein